MGCQNLCRSCHAPCLWVCAPGLGATYTTKGCALALLGLSVLSELHCSLHPGLEMCLVFCWQLLDLLMVNMPVQPSDEVLVMESLGQSVDSLTSCLLEQDLLKLPPWISYGELVFQKQWRSCPCPCGGLRHTTSTQSCRRWWLPLVF